MAPGVAIGHLAGDVTWPWKVTIMASICVGNYLEIDWRYTLSYGLLTWP